MLSSIPGSRFDVDLKHFVSVTVSTIRHWIDECNTQMIATSRKTPDPVHSPTPDNLLQGDRAVRVYFYKEIFWWRLVLIDITVSRYLPEKTFMIRAQRNLALLTTFSAAVLLAACGGGGTSGSDGSSGTLSVSLTDAPACGYDEVNVTVQKVRVHQSGTAAESEGGWTDITLNPAKKINLLNLTNGVLENLGQTALPAGRYTQLRLVLDPNVGANSLANSIVLTSDAAKTPIHLDTPSAVQSGIKLIKPFEVTANQRVDLVLDFDACKSIVTKGNGGYALKPVVEVIPTVLNGIAGYIDPALLESNVTVTAQQNGVIKRSTVPKASGEFFLARMEPGSYDVVLTADNRATAVVAAVPVVADKTVNLSSTGTPITLAAATNPRSISGRATLSPASATEVAYVAAQQTFSSGTKVTVKYKGADVSSGNYTLANLPTVAPQLASYTATLPLQFNAQPNTNPGTGKYSVEASATGYTSKSVTAVDISAMSQNGVNFTLAP